MRVAIITYCRREDGHAGGVPKWAWYLKRALAEAAWRVEHFAWSDYPGRARHEGEAEPRKVALLAGWLAARGKLDSCDRIVADGFWACALPDDAPVTVVCHGTWAGLAAACGGVDAGLIEAQGEAYRRFPVVAVSEAAARQVRRYHKGNLVAVIPNGVDLEVFRPAQRPPSKPPVVLYAGKGYAKGEDLVQAVARALEGIARVEYLDAPVGMETRAFQRGDVFLFPSRHEGDSYALKEAAACGLPAVASAVGALQGERAAEIGEVVEGFEAEDYRAAVQRVLANRGAYNPRAWAERNADLRDFARRWGEYLSGACTGTTAGGAQRDGTGGAQARVPVVHERPA